MTPLTVLIPVHNGARWIDDVLAAIRAQTFDAPVEILVVEDGSTDGSRALLERHAAAGTLTLLEGPRRGAAAALNAGLRAASHPLIAQIDQDVVLQPGWMTTLVAALDNPSVAAAQGQYVAAPRAGLWSRVMALDLRERYTHLAGGWTNHACTGNSVYRASALHAVGLFDETLGYGYDNDLSYRLTGAGYRLAYRSEAHSAHHWREGAREYLRQQFGFGYGRIDLVAKHRGRLGGDDVSRWSMMLHGPLMATALVLLAAAGALAVANRPAAGPALAALILIAIGAGERFIAGVRAARQFRDLAGLWFAPVHLARDLAWVAAIAVWLGRRLRGGRAAPSDSMRPRTPSPGIPNRTGP